MMKMTKFDNLLNKYKISFIALALILIFINHYNLLQLNFNMENTGLLLFALNFIIGLYLDIRYRKYTTSIFIIIVDAVEIILLLTACYFNFQEYDKSDFDAVWDRNSNIKTCFFLMIFMRPIKSFLESEKFTVNKATDTSTDTTT